MSLKRGQMCYALDYLERYNLGRNNMEQKPPTPPPKKKSREKKSILDWGARGGLSVPRSEIVV